MLVLLSGVSGAGKDTIKQELLKRMDNVTTMPSYTDRSPRPGEQDGVVYNFVTTEEFEQNIKDNKFLEYANFAGNYYGTKKKYIDEKIKEGFNVILEIDTQGALQVKEKMPESVLIFIAPPSIEELEHRLRGRHTEDEETIQKRLAQVKTELERSQKYDYTVINDNINRAVEEIESIVKK